jgi:hypothetical protein
VNIKGIRKRIPGGGFKPFSVRTSDGREYAVRHPEWVLVGPRSLAVLDKDGEIATLDPMHIVAIKDLPPARNSLSKS